MNPIGASINRRILIDNFLKRRESNDDRTKSFGASANSAGPLPKIVEIKNAVEESPKQGRTLLAIMSGTHPGSQRVDILA